MSDQKPQPGVVRLLARDVPLPGSLSPEARGYMEWLISLPEGQGPVDALRKPGLVAAIPQMEAAMLAFAEPLLAACDSDTSIETIGGVRTAVARRRSGGGDGGIQFHLHGGGFVLGGGRACEAFTAKLSDDFGGTVYGVDYRMPPAHPFPAAVDDSLAVYREIIRRHEPKQIYVSAISAGGSIAGATLLRAKAEGLPMPAALVLQTPSVDLEETGDSPESLMYLDPMLKSLGPETHPLYANGHDMSDPLLSPINGDLRGFPPTILTTGTRDLLLSATVLMHRALRRAGVTAELHVWDGMPHGGLGGQSPEDREVVSEIRAFLDRYVATKA